MSFFAAVQDAVKAEIKSKATSSRNMLIESVEKAVKLVEDSKVFQEHVEFNEERYFQLPSNTAAAAEENEDNDEELTRSVVAPPVLVVGSVTFSMLSCFRIPSSKKALYLEIQVENQTQKSPVSKVSMKTFAWKESFSFPISDFKTTVAIRVMHDRVLHEDELLGQVLIPLERLHKSSLVLSFQNEHDFREGPLTYSLFPLSKSHHHYLPAVVGLSRSGMDRPSGMDPELGFLTCTVDLHLNTNISRLYLSSKPFDFPMRKKKSLGTLGTTLDAARTIRHLQRQRFRFERLGALLLKGEVAVVYALVKARSFASREFSWMFIFFHTWVCLSWELYCLPFYFWFLVLLGAWLLEVDSVPAQVLVWNEVDKDGLNPVQELSRLLWIAEQSAVYLKWLADVLERCVNLLSFQDAHVSFWVVFLGGLLFATGLSTLLYWVNLRVLAVACFWVWVFAPVDFQTKFHQAKLMWVPRRKSDKAKKNQFDSKFQPLVNLWKRVPTMDHLDHVKICHLQICESDEDNGVEKME